MNNPEYMTLYSNTFITNSAFNNTDFEVSGNGGAIYYTCEKTFKCKVEIKYGNIFKNNSASNSGGGIKWDDLEPSFTTDNVFDKNKATLYGDDIACFA
jgi:hypothetical protein